MTNNKEVCVENTNSDSLLSKLSVVDCGYRVDPFLRELCSSSCIKSRRSPAINRGYLARLISLEATFEKLLMLATLANLNKFQVLSLGAGYDSMYFRLRNMGIIKAEVCKYVEVDFDSSMSGKNRRISSSPLLKSFFSTLQVSPDCFSYDEGQYCLVGCNMTDIPDLESKLTRMAFDRNAYTVVLTECSTTYVDAEKCNRLLSFLNGHLHNFHFVSYEQIRPDDRFGRIMTRHFQKRNSPLKCIGDYPRIEHHTRRYLNLGFKHAQVKTIADLWHMHVGDSEQRLLRNVVSDCFDECPELMLKCNHYVLIVAGTSPTLLMPDTSAKYHPCPEPEDIVPVVVRPTTSDDRRLARVCQRYGHTVWTSDQKLFILGGYGQSGARDHLVASLSLEDNFSVSSLSSLPAARQQSASAATTKGAYIFGGRASPLKPSNELTFIHPSGQCQVVECALRPAPRWGHSLSPLFDGKLVLVGGRNLQTVFKDIWCFDLYKGQWNHIHDLPHGLYSHSAAHHSGSGLLVITGGLVQPESMSVNSNIYTFSFQKGEEENEFKSSVVGIIPSSSRSCVSRFSHTSHITSDSRRLIMIGGVSASNACSSNLVIVDLISLQSSHFCLPLLNETLQPPLVQHASVLLEQEILLIGGGTNCFSFGMHINPNIYHISLVKA